MTAPSLQELEEAGLLRPIDVQVAQALCRLGSETRPEVELAVALTSRHVGRGHVCLDLDHWVTQSPLEMVASGIDPQRAAVLAERQWDEPGAWRVVLESSPLVTQPGSPVILDAQGRVYLARYFGHQGRLAHELGTRAGRLCPDVDEQVLRQGLARLFPAPGLDLQRVAALTAVLRLFCVVSGGPGTGKTATVVRILALLHEQRQALSLDPPRVLLLAPTGKAAARMGDSIQAALGSLDIPAEVSGAIGTDASTIHRALGYVGRATEFRHNVNNPLPADVVIVDEASMIAFGLLARLVDAVHPDARLVLLGDKDQLASVEAGAVLGDICNAGGSWRYTQIWRDRVASLSGDEIEVVGRPEDPSGEVGDGIVQLTHSWRFGRDSGVAALSRAVNSGDVEGVLGSGQLPDVNLCEYDPAQLPVELFQEASQRFQPWMNADGAQKKLEAFGQFRILCAHRRGRFGVEEVNRRMVAMVGDLSAAAGQPVLITENDYALDLFNGDVGVVMSTEDGSRAFFASPAGLRVMAPARLPAHEVCYAMTVHKSQGSEFDSVAVVLPPDTSPILTRELLYTAVTRARCSVTIYSPAKVLRYAVEHRIERASGLRSILWQKAR